MRTRTLAVMAISVLALIGCTGSGSTPKAGSTTTGAPTAGGTTPTANAFAPSSAPVSDGAGYCVVLKSGGVDCWGRGVDGELGNGRNDESDVPVAVVGTGGTGRLAGVKSVVAAGGGYCAVLTSGGVACWGSGVTGRRGPGNGSNVPVAAPGVGGSGTLSGVKSVVAAGGGYCAVLSSGGLDCWGVGVGYVLGNGFNSKNDTPVAVRGVGGTGGLSRVDSVVTDSERTSGSTCALLTSGEVDCWGTNGYGNLGNGTTQDIDTPGAVLGIGGRGTLTGVKSLANPGGGAYCAVLTSGGVDCWGVNTVGQLGNGTEAGPDSCQGAACSTTPVAVLDVGVAGSQTRSGNTGTLSGVVSVVSALSASCAIVASGGVDCWGQGMYGELGDGTNLGRTRSDVPVAVAGVGGAGTLSGVKTVVSGGTSFCAVLTSGAMYCWGKNPSGVLGDGTTTGPESCLSLAGRVPCSTKPVAVSWVLGTGPATGPLSGVVAASNGGDSYCALLASDGLYCWGANNQGQLGTGTTISSDIAVFVVPPP